MRRARWAALTSALGVGLVCAPPLPLAHAAAPVQRAAPCPQPREAGQPRAQLPAQLWPQEQLNFTEAWELTRGRGVKVAVIDSGVDATHPQLRGKVKQLDVTKTGTEDCVGHGTEVAGIIGATDMRRQGIPFLGVAPGVQLISIKAAVGGEQNDPKWAPAAIRRAVDLGAKVINMSSQSPDYAELRAAVQYALQKDVVIVAAAGNLKDQSQTARNAYPASYQGVIAVGALNKDGSLATFSNQTTPVTVTAPGQSVVSTWPQGTYHVADGTSQAAPFVAGTAALIRSYHPKMNREQVKRQIELTADGSRGQGTGSGVVNPLRAVTTVARGQAAVANGPQKVKLDQPPPDDPVGRMIALSIAGVTLTAAAGVAVGSVVIPAGRRRGWRAES
ncbi:type VII secretion-associated serine protease mycosin [Actinomadura vinacea]|uniref:Type VII secretion-associated serine protease mycosin n=1 Tax=Actinomadura vinacea TaxID=115336 RepID=A0ABN3JCJ2_9ACTN